jgi:hypothetical protein
LKVEDALRRRRKRRAKSADRPQLAVRGTVPPVCPPQAALQKQLPCPPLANWQMMRFHRKFRRKVFWPRAKPPRSQATSAEKAGGLGAFRREMKK